MVNCQDSIAKACVEEYYTDGSCKIVYSEDDGQVASSYMKQLTSTTYSGCHALKELGSLYLFRQTQLQVKQNLNLL